MSTVVQQLSERLSELVAQPPPPPPVDGYAAAGRGVLRRRRKIGSSLVLTALVVPTTVALASVRQPEPVRAGSVATTSDGAMATACSTGHTTSRYWTRRLFSGDARVVASTTTTHLTAVAFLSQDRSLWGLCFRYRDGRLFSTLSVFPTDRRSSYGEPLSSGVIDPGGAGAQSVALVGGLSAEVAAVRITWLDGRTETRKTDAGWIALSHTAFHASSSDPGRRSYRRMQYLASDGTVLAEGVPPVAKSATPGVPDLSAYPPLANDYPLGEPPA